MFRGENYNLRSDHNGLRIPVAGRYRITVTGSAYQPRSSVTMSLKRQNDIQGDSELFAAWDVDDKFRTVSTIKYLRPDDYFYVSADELEPAPDGKVIYNSQPASEFKGEGVRVRKVLVEGPLEFGGPPAGARIRDNTESTWPPQRTRALFPGVHGEHHPLSHHGQDPAKIAQLKIIESGILSTFSDFLTQLGRRSAQGTRLLDHTAVLFGSNLGNANAHDPSNLPIILAGGGYKHGRYIAHDKNKNTPLCNLFVNMLNNMGVETDSFATSSGELSW